MSRDWENKFIMLGDRYKQNCDIINEFVGNQPKSSLDGGQLIVIISLSLG